ncbi:MAG: hypothetical protein ACRCYY_14100 [Trueperaceae bacterium]
MGQLYVGTDKNGTVYSIAQEWSEGSQGQWKVKNLIRSWNGRSWQTQYIFKNATSHTFEGSYIEAPAILSSLSFQRDGKPAGYWKDPLWVKNRISLWNGTSWNDIYKLTYTSEDFTDTLLLDKQEQCFGFKEDFSDLYTNPITIVQGNSTLALLQKAYLTSTVIAVDNFNRPIIALNETSLDIIVKSWTGSDWVNLGGTLDKVTTQDAKIGSLAFDSRNTLYAAWVECFEKDNTTGECKNTNVYVSRYVP